MARTGGELVVETLKAAGVDTVFGIISVHNIPIYDAMLRDGSIRPIMVRHEQAAAGMADGYARATGRLGVAITSTGPGAANTMGAMVEAYRAGSPVLQIAGNIESQYLGRQKGFLHETKDQLGMLATVTKWAGQVQDTSEIPTVLMEAIMQALSGRRGPVAVEIPIDLQYLDADADIPIIHPLSHPTPDVALIGKAADLLATAQRPLIWAGGGALASGAGHEILSLARHLGTGVLTSASGRGVIPEDDPHCIGNLSLEPAVQDLLLQEDVLLAVGVRFTGPHTRNWRPQLPATIIHVDIDAEQFNRNYPATVAVHGDARAALPDIIAGLDGRRSTEPGWTDLVFALRSEARAHQRHAVGPHAEVMDTLRRILPRDTVIVKDATIPAYTWGNRLLEVYEPRTSLHSASTAIGPGLALALGAAAARPERPAVLIAGDGGFMLNIAELSTAAQYGLRVISLVFNDQGYGVLRNIQDAIFAGRHVAVDLSPVDFAGVAEAMGVPGRRVTARSGFGEALDWALAQRGPALLDIDMDGIGPMNEVYAGTSRPPEPRVR